MYVLTHCAIIKDDPSDQVVRFDLFLYSVFHLSAEEEISTIGEKTTKKTKNKKIINEIF